MWRTFLTEQRDFVHGTDALEAVIDQVRCPTLVMSDPADTLVPVATAHALHAQIRGSQLRLVTHGGHSLHRRNPTVVAEAITCFVSNLRGDRGTSTPRPGVACGCTGPGPRGRTGPPEPGQRVRGSAGQGVSGSAGLACVGGVREGLRVWVVG